MNKTEKTVVVGMSGGVDSSVAAYLLKKQGYHVIGVTMQIWQDESGQNMSDSSDNVSPVACQNQQKTGTAWQKEQEGGCCGWSAIEDARRVAQCLDIPHYVMNFKKEFQEEVITPFVKEYRRGRTPNPCLRCNRFVKWEAFLQRSREIGADYIATGHYAKISKQSNGRYAVLAAFAAGTTMNALPADAMASSEGVLKHTMMKDQSYALYALTQEQLAHTLFPCGDYSKPQIRQIAREAGLPIADKPDSQEICFVPDGDYASFIERETGQVDSPGNFVTTEGKILGRHLGISHYTIGQRKGLGLSMGHPVFVVQIRPESNEVVIGTAEDVFTTELLAEDISYMGQDCFEAGENVYTKIRYRDAGAPASLWPQITQDGLRVLVRFEHPVRAVTPGQAVVFYRDGVVLGGGTIA